MGEKVTKIMKHLGKTVSYGTVAAIGAWLSASFTKKSRGEIDELVKLLVRLKGFKG